MNQARIVIRDAALERGEHLLRVTKLASLTELINVMFSRYGQHLEDTWEVKALSPTYAKPEPLPEFTEPQAATPLALVASNFTFDEPLTGL